MIDCHSIISTAASEQHLEHNIFLMALDVEHSILAASPTQHHQPSIMHRDLDSNISNALQLRTQHLQLSITSLALCTENWTLSISNAAL